MSKQKLTLHLEGSPHEIVAQCLDFASQYGGGAVEKSGTGTVVNMQAEPIKRRGRPAAAPKQELTQDTNAYNDGAAQEDGNGITPDGDGLNKLLLASEYITDKGREQTEAMNEILNYYEVGGLAELDPAKYSEVFDMMMEIPGAQD